MKYFVVAFFLLSNIAMVHADVFAVTDSALLANAIEQLAEMKKQFDQAVEQYAKLKEQTQILIAAYEEAQKQVKEMKQFVKLNSGHFKFGDLLNSDLDVKLKKSADSWFQTLQGISGGNKERYNELIAAYKQQHQHLNPEVFVKDSPRQQLFVASTAVTRAASLESDVAFEEVNKRLEDIHTLSKQIETANSTKAAIDLNSRLLAEIAYLQAENLKGQTIINKQLAEQAESAHAEEAMHAKFLALPAQP